MSDASPRSSPTQPAAHAALRYVHPSSLTPYTNNARTHSDAQIKQIAESIKRFGFTNPVLVSDDGEIIAGHGRVRAALALGLPEVPTCRRWLCRI